MAEPHQPQQPQLTPQMQQQLQQLQALNQNLQATAQQRQQYDVMKAESEQALEALGAVADDAPVYRSVGALLVADTKSGATARLKEDLETLEMRSGRLQKQETQLREQMAALQQKLQAAMGAPGGKGAQGGKA